MKKLALVFGAVLALASCSDVDDKTSTADTPLLLKTFTNDGGSMTIIYNGNKVVNLGGTTYTYTGDLITKEVSTDGVSISQTDYTYDGNGRLISVADTDNNGTGTAMSDGGKTVYTYNTDGTITAQRFNAYNAPPKILWTVVSTFANGNLVKEEYLKTDGSSEGIVLYEYDNKINPYHNITGYSKLLDSDADGVSKNNVTKSTSTVGSGVMASVYTYNDKGYPLTCQTTQILTTTTPGSIPETNVYNYKYSY